ncbi:ABC transporter permease (plasmid) [Mesorhizobium sp. ORM8.1]
MDIAFMVGTITQLLAGVPLTLSLAGSSLVIGAILALLIALANTSAYWPLRMAAQAYVFVLRGTPLLVQLFLIYYGLSQFPTLRDSILWPFLRDPYWCALLAFTLNTAAYGSEAIRGGLLAVPSGAVEAARACGMSRLKLFRRIVFPIAIRHAIPAYSNEIVGVVKSTSLASMVTLAEVTGIAGRITSDTFRVVEVFVCAAIIYLAINFLLTRAILLLEFWLSPHLRQPASAT